MGKHATHGPSSLDKLSHCIRFKYGEMDDESASEGSDLHESCERESVAGLTEVQARDVQTCLDFVASLKATEGGPTMWTDTKEAKVELPDLTYGTTDRLLVHVEKPIMHVIDWKFTRISSEHAFQVETYGAAAYDMFGDDRDWDVHLHVVAPRIPDITSAVWAGKILHAMVIARIEELYKRIDSPWLPETPHPDTCPKCARAATCPSLQKTAVVAAQRIGLPVPSDFAVGGIATMRDRALAQILAGALDNWATAVKKANAEHCKATGETPEGFKLVTRSTGLRVPKELTPAALQALEEAGFDPVTLLECCNLTVGDVAKKVSAYTARKESDIKDEVREALVGIATEGSCDFLQKCKKTSDEAMLLGMG